MNNVKKHIRRIGEGLRIAMVIFANVVLLAIFLFIVGYSANFVWEDYNRKKTNQKLSTELEGRELVKVAELAIFQPDKEFDWDEVCAQHPYCEEINCYEYGWELIFWSHKVSKEATLDVKHVGSFPIRVELFGNVYAGANVHTHICLDKKKATLNRTAKGLELISAE